MQPRAGICPYCGGNISSGRNVFKAVESEAEPPEVRNDRRKRTRLFGLGQVVVGAVLIAVLAPSRRPIPLFLAGMLAAHGLYRLIFTSGWDREEEDYDND